jgi:hypothetical protein
MDGNRIRILTEGNEDHEVGQEAGLVISYRLSVSEDSGQEFLRCLRVLL